MRRAIVVTGLAFGDEGKGATVDALCRHVNASLVIRHCGGPQAGHNVVLEDGRSHCFAQWGSGTLAGVRTYLGPMMIVDPLAMVKEAEHLEKIGLPVSPWDQLSAHPACLVTTPYHAAVNKLQETERGANRHGSCGMGVGVTRQYWLDYGNDALTLGDCGNVDAATNKLELLRQRMIYQLRSGFDEFQGNVYSEVLNESPRSIARSLYHVVYRFGLRLTPAFDGTVIFEGAQGVMLDENVGFHPYTTWSTVTQRHALEMMDELSIEEVCSVGVTRAYATRHGPGPLPSETRELFPPGHDKNNKDGEWQGAMRFGCLDLPLLRHAIKNSGGPVDCLAVNCLDERTEWPVCMHNRSQLGNHTLPDAISVRSVVSMLGEIVPVAIKGYGPSAKDKSIGDLPWRSVN